MGTRIWKAFVVATLALASCDQRPGSPGATGSEASAINGGLPDPSGPSHDWIVFIEHSNASETAGVETSSCTASLISPDHILTAAHCLFPHCSEPPAITLPSIKVSVGADRTSPLVTANGVAYFVHPGTLSGDATSGFCLDDSPSYTSQPWHATDEAIVQLDRRIVDVVLPKRPVTGVPSFPPDGPPNPWPKDLFGNILPSSTYQATAVGFGITPVTCGQTVGTLPATRGSSGVLYAALANPAYDGGFIYAQSFPLNERFVTAGDSGGPLLIFPDGDPSDFDSALLVGTAATIVCTPGDSYGGESEQWAPTYTPSNSLFILSTMIDPVTGWRGDDDFDDSDQDTDRVDDDHDNCPYDYNPDQADADTDGLGDVCDPCPTVAKPNSSIDTNEEAEYADYNPAALDHDVHVTAENCPAVFPSSPTDVDHCPLVKGKHQHYTGNGCDTVPLVAPALVSESTIDSQISCATPMAPNASCALTRNDQIQYTQFHTNGGSNTVLPLNYGFRFCKCDQGYDLTTVAGRISCTANGICPFKDSAVNHTLLSPDYFHAVANTNPWRPIHNDGVLGKVFSDSGFAASWQFAQTPKLTKWNLDLDGPDVYITPGSTLHPEQLATTGVLWSHIDPLAGYDQNPGLDPAQATVFGDLADTFVNGSVASSVTAVSLLGGVKQPGLRVLPPNDFCPACGFGDKQPYLFVDNATSPPRYLATTGTAQTDISPLLAPDVMTAFQGGTVVIPSEPLPILEARGVLGWRMIQFDASLSVTGLFGGTHGLAPIRVPGTPIGVGPDAAALESPATPPAAVDAKLLGSGVSNLVWRVGGQIAGAPSQDLWTYSIRTGQWRSDAISGVGTLGKVLDATYRFSDSSLYVIDDTKDAHGTRIARLLRIRRAGLGEVVRTWPRAALSDVTLSVSERDELVITLARTSALALAHLVIVADITGGQLVPQAWSIREGHPVLRPHLTNVFLTEAINVLGSTKIVDVSRAQLVPAEGFCGDGWW